MKLFPEVVCAIGTRELGFQEKIPAGKEKRALLLSTAWECSEIKRTQYAIGRHSFHKFEEVLTMSGMEVRAML